LKLELGRSSTGRAVRAKWHIDHESIQISALHRSTATSAELDQEERREEESEDPLLYRYGFPEANRTGDPIWFTGTCAGCRRDRSHLEQRFIKKYSK